MRGKKKKGNVLLVVVGLFAFISVLVISLMMVTTTGFQLRKDESARIENFYGADSGIEIAEDITVKLIGEAIEKGNTAAENIKGEWEEKNKVFRKEFSQYIRDNFKKRVDNVKGDGKEVSTEYEKFKKDGQPIKVEVKKFDEEVLEVFKVELISSFKDKKGKDRIVSVNYDLETPNYGIEIVKNPFKSQGSNLLDYVIATDGNLYIDNAIQQDSDLDIYGDLWIGGNEKKNDRFGRGIHIKGDENIKSGKGIDIDGKVATRGSVNIENENIKFHKDVFSRDFKIVGDKNLVNIKDDLYVYNDLIFEAEDTTLTLNNYYGLNDLNYEKWKDFNLEESQRSSSIIVNSKDFGVKETLFEKGSSIIANDMYIAGTAYIGGINPTDELKNYQSGESIVINRNTKPYTDRESISSMKDSEKKEYLFKYKRPLHMVDKIYKDNAYKELEIRDKVQLVENYYKKSENKLENKLEYEGIKVPNEKIVSTGVSYANGKVVNSNPLGVKLGEQQKKFVEEVYLRNTRNAEIPLDFWARSEDVSVEGSINWNAIARITQKETISVEVQEANGDIVKKEVFKKHPIDADNNHNGNLGIYKSEIKISEIVQIAKKY